MARDYAKKTRKQSSSRRAPARQESSNSLWWVALVLIVLFVGGLIYLKRHGATITVSPAATESTKPRPSSVKPSQATTPKTPATPRFDFYTVLPKSQVTADAKKPMPSQPVYMLQLGVFSSYAAADELKARATLLGVETSISSFQKEENTLYRVWMGPYKTKAEVQQQQHKLQATQLKSVIVKQEQHDNLSSE